jgi:2',3'-cyclic-nucleotide 2'-phosphodiesterase (5'-nucleotidase family)
LTFIKKLRDQGRQERPQRPLILIDGGDIFKPGQHYQALYGEFFMQALNLMGYDAFNIGDGELREGMDVIAAMQHTARFAMISTNAKSGEAASSWQPYRILEVQGVRLALLGVVDPALTANTKQTITVAPPRSQVEKQLEALGGKADIYILMAHMSLEKSVDLATEITGIDLVVAGHVANPVEGQKVGRTLVVSPGKKGENIILADMVWNKRDKKISAIESRLVPLDSSIAEDPAIAGLINTLNVKIENARNAQYQRQTKQKADNRILIDRSLKMTPEEFLNSYNKKETEHREAN